MPSPIPIQVLKLIKVYQQAQENLIKIIAEKEARGNVTTYQKSLLRQVQYELNKLDKSAYEWSAEIVPEFYEQGIVETNKALAEMGVKVEDIPFAQLHTRAIALMVNNAYQNLHDANNFVGRLLSDSIRDAGIEAVSQKLAIGQTVKECKRALVQKLTAQGINGIRDKRGRLISLDAYASTVARSTTAEATNRATMNHLQELGYDLVKMTQHYSPCPICAPLEGRVYSITGNTPGYPKLDIAFSGPYANIHPNCRHRLVPYIPSLADDPEKDREFSNRPFDMDPRSKASKDSYDRQQKKLTGLRNDRDQYKRYKAALGEYAPKSFAGFRRMKYNNGRNWGIIQTQYKAMGYYNKAVANELVTTKLVVDNAEKLGFNTAGLEYRIKSRESYLRKVKSNYSPEGNEYEINDILRYTYTTGPNSLADKTISSIDLFRTSGYETVKVKNTWLNPNEPYKGINTIVRAPDGQKFELQYHTPESFALKNGELHKLYEEYRLLDKDSPKAIELQDKMFELSMKLSIPKDIEKVK